MVRQHNHLLTPRAQTRLLRREATAQLELDAKQIEQVG